MSDYTYTIDEISSIVTPVAKQYGVDRVYLFGSYARGSQSTDSDMDFRIDGGKITTLFKLAEFYEDLRERIKAPIDVLTTEALDDDFLQRIKNEEKLLYAAN
jgi:predicted nucleotidyltransferase